MASFEELQAIAAARSKASQEKLAAERATREAAEQAKKLAHDEKLRLSAIKDRELLVAKEQRKKKEEDERKRFEEEKRKKMEKREHEMRMKERETLDKAKFQSAAHKAFKKIRSSAKEKVPMGRRGRNESVSPPPNQREHSTLTREEKRQRKEAAMLGLTSSSKKKGPSSQSHRVGSGSNGSSVGTLMPLGMHKRDIRRVDEIERDLMAFRGRDLYSDRIGEDEGMQRRKRAMEAKRIAQERTLRHSSLTDSDDLGGAYEHKNSPIGKRRDRSPINDRPNKLKKKATSASAVTIPFGLSPADYLPGAPIKAIPKAIMKETSPEEPRHSKNGSRKDMRGTQKVIEKAGPPKKETARDKFLREEAERKSKLAKKRQIDDDSDEDSEDDDDDESDEEDSDEESEEESDDEDLPRGKQSDVSKQIWQMFNRRDKSEYLARDIDSDDEDMEADMECLRREELRSARIARMEDEREEAEQRRREQEKARKRAEKRRA